MTRRSVTTLTFEQAARILRLKPEDGPFPVTMTIMMAHAELDSRKRTVRSKPRRKGKK